MVCWSGTKDKKMFTYAFSKCLRVYYVPGTMEKEMKISFWCERQTKKTQNFNTVWKRQKIRETFRIINGLTKVGTCKSSQPERGRCKGRFPGKRLPVF